MGTSWRLLAVLPLAALAIGGCGGGGGGESTASAPVETTETTSLSKEELITQGDAICAEVNAAVGSAGSTSSEAGEEVVQVAGLYGGMVERLKSLGPPSGESAGYPEFISSAEALAQAEENVKLAYEREETDELTTAAAEVSSALTKFEFAAAAFGFESCAEAPAAPTPSGSGEAAGEEESSGGVEEGVPPEEEVEAAPEEAPPVEEESAGGGAGVGGGTEGGGGGSGGGSSGGIGAG